MAKKTPQGLSQEARFAAQKRLQQEFPERWEQLLIEERKARGFLSLPPSEVERLIERRDRYFEKAAKAEEELNSVLNRVGHNNG